MNKAVESVLTDLAIENLNLRLEIARLLEEINQSNKKHNDGKSEEIGLEEKE